jgi:predicted transcriptional regulator
MTSKVTISLPEELLARLDAEATDLGVARSELVRESLATYLGRTRDERIDDARRARMLEALEGMRTMHERYPIRDDRPSLEILREIRATDDSAPLRDVRKDRR